MTKVYVSSTYQDLKDLRSRVLKQLRKLDMVDVAMEHYTADERGPLERCLADVRASDVHVTILAWRYGFVPEGLGASITELEYREAGARGIDRLVFQLSPEAPWPPPFMDRMNGESDQGQRIANFRDELARTLTVSFFGSAEELDREILAALSQWRLRKSDKAVTPAAGFTARDPLRDYLESVIVLDGVIDACYVELEGTTQVAATPAASEWPVPMFPGAYERAVRGTLGLGEAPTIDKELDDVAAALASHRRFVLLGESGAGKTTTLRRLRLSAARAALLDLGAPIPMLIRLAEWPASIADFPSLLVHERQVQGVPLVNPARLLLLLDGLNEVSAETYELRVGPIEDWLRQSPLTRVVVAARARHYAQHRQLSLPTVQIHPLRRARIETFVRRNLAADSVSSFLAELDSDVRELARTPFLLGLLCYVYSRPERRLARTRTDLLHMAVLSLYDREQELGNAGGITFDMLVDGLGALALALVVGRYATSVSMDWARKRLPQGIDAAQLVHLAESAGLFELGKKGRFLNFSHQLYLEHFGAQYLARHPGRLAEILQPPQFAHGERLPRHADEVVCALVAMVDPAVVAEIAACDPFLAADAFVDSEHAQVPAEIREAIVDQLLEEIASDDLDRWTAAAIRLPNLGEEAIVGLRRRLATGSPIERRRAVVVLGQLNLLDAIDAVASALRDSKKWVRREAQRSLANPDEESRLVLGRYIEERLAPKPADERMAIARALASCWGADEPELTAKLRDTVGYVEEAVAATPEVVPVDSPPAAVDDAEEVDAAALTAQGRAWRGQWHAHPGDPELARLGRRLLRAAPPWWPHWGSVWQELWRASTGNAQLAELGTDWLPVAPAATPAWPHVWHLLWRETPGDGSLAELAERWLAAAPPEQGSWQSIWSALWTLQPSGSLEDGARLWLAKASFHPSWGFLWTQLSSSIPGDRALQLLGEQWLDLSPHDHNSWAFVWLTLWDRSKTPERARQGYRWLCEVGEVRVNWHRIWLALRAEPEVEVERIEALGRAWLREESNRDQLSWPFLWRDLWKPSRRDDELRSLGSAWLATAPVTTEGWTQVWPPLFDADPDSPTLERVGRLWIAQAPVDHDGWGYLWPALRQRFQSDTEIERCGREWLRSASVELPSWPFVFLALADQALKDVEVQEAGRRFLASGPPESARWSAVWKKLWDAGIGVDELAALAVRWLETVSVKNVSWGTVWRRLTARGLADGLPKITERWLREAPLSHPDWGSIWARLREMQSLPRDLEPRGDEWLAQVDESALDWGRVRRQVAGEEEGDVDEALGQLTKWSREWERRWENLWDAGASHVALALAAVPFLRERVDDPNWQFVWERLVQEAPDEEVIALGHRWLEKRPLTTKRWRSIWQTVAHHRRGDLGMLEMGLARLELDLSTPAGWPALWHDLWDESPAARNQLRTLGLEWLERQPPAARGWAGIWLTLSRDRPGDRALLERGLDRVGPEHTRGSYWPRVWRHLWEHLAKDSPGARELLEGVARQWLEAHVQSADAWMVWLDLWQARVRDERLRQWGEGFASTCADPQAEEALRTALDEGDAAPHDELRDL